MVTELLRTLASLFHCTNPVTKGKDKYMKFNWIGQSCSVFLLPPDRGLPDVGQMNLDLGHIYNRNELATVKERLSTNMIGMLLCYPFAVLYTTISSSTCKQFSMK